VLARRAKYGNIRTCGYASRLEAQRAWELQQLQKAGTLSDLREQPSVRLAGDVRYRADFSYTENGRTIYEDAKGIVTDRFRVVCQLWPFFGPGPLRIVAKKGGRIVMVREIMPVER
jgi:hypothetical protein